MGLIKAQLDNFMKHSYSFAMTIFHKITKSAKLVILLIVPTYAKVSMIYLLIIPFGMKLRKYSKKKDKQHLQNIHIDRKTRIPLKTGGELMCLDQFSLYLRSPNPDKLTIITICIWTVEFRCFCVLSKKTNFRNYCLCYWGQ
jgi:hypothetical protein